MTHRTKGTIDRREFLRGAAGAVVGSLLLPQDLLGSSPGSLTPAGTFDMIVLGDSIMWGQGLKDEQKFSSRVERWVRSQLPGIEVRRRVFAHSGARIKENEVEDEKPPMHGEVPQRFPSITAQLERAATMPRITTPVARIATVPVIDPATVSLVLLDGGINDFGSKVIINPDPTVGRAWVRRVTREKTVDRMKELLPKVAVAFPNAKIVITNYFQIVSEKSDMVYVWELLRAWDLVGGPINAMSAPLRTKMSDQALAFHEESTAGFREAVREVSHSLLANAKAPPPRGIATNVERLALPPGRVALAEVGFGPEHAYGAPQTRLFYVNEPDPAASVRKPICVEELSSSPAELANCLIAATGHPNLAGARAYADAIIGVAQRWLPEWQAAFGVTPPKTTVPSQRMIRRP
jgi:hypothetical protein